MEHDPQPRGVALCQGFPAYSRQRVLKRCLHLLTNVCLHINNKVDEPAAYKPQDLPHGSVYSLDSHHSHFVLVEEDPNRSGATSEMRVKLLKHISLQRTVYGGKGLRLSAGSRPRIL